MGSEAEAGDTSEGPRRPDEALLDALSDGLIIVDAHDTVRFVNAAVTRFLGRSRDQLVGRQVWEAFPEASGLPFFAHYHQVQSDRAPAQFEAYYPPQDVWLEERLAPLPDGGVIADIWDVSVRKRLEETLAARASELQAIFDAIPDGVYVYQPDGSIQEANAVGRRALAAELAEHNARSQEERISAFQTRLRGDSEALMTREEYPVARILRGETLTGDATVDLTARMPDGHVLELSFNGAPIRDESGQITGAVGVWRDVTERRRLEAEVAVKARQLRAIFDAISDGIWVYDTAERIVEANTAARRFLPKNLTAYSARPLEERIRDYHVRLDDGAPPTGESWPFFQILHGETITGDMAVDAAVRLPDGGEYEVSLGGAPIQDDEGRVVGVVAVAHDVTERKRLERQRIEILRTVAHDLSNPLATAKLGLQSYDRLQQARERLNAQLKQEVGLAVEPHADVAESGRPAVDHTTGGTEAPGSASIDRARISSFLEQERQLNESIAFVMEHLNDGVSRMERLVGDLTTAIRLEKSGGLTLKRVPFDLADACWREALALQGFTEHTLVADIPREPVEVAGDADAVRRVIANLLSNADKYSPVDRPITITLSHTSEGWERVTVTDEGPGIPEAERERVWEQFHRVAGIKAHDTAGGLGLGLAICRGIIEQLGGKIGLESEVGIGSTFWFTLPPPASTAQPANAS